MFICSNFASIQGMADSTVQLGEDVLWEKATKWETPKILEHIFH